MPGMIVGVDVGGTFTDVVAADEHRLTGLKVPSQPRRPAATFLEGLRKIMRRMDGHSSEVGRIVHGTTIGTNAVLEQKGATLGILTTHGFEDILAIGRSKRSDMYDLMMDAEEPLFLAPRRQIVGIRERVDSQGRVLEPLDEGEVVREVKRLTDRFGVNAIAVCYLFSFLHPEHERRTAAVIGEHFPDLSVSLSSLVDPKFREYERLVVTAFDAYLRPIVGSYVQDLQTQLCDHGFLCPLQIMQSNGGITSASLAAERPVGTVLSGPAAGVVAGSALGRAAGFDNLVTLDMGGTSFDVALVRGGTIQTGSEGRIGRYPLRLPMVDVHTIGAGGGSIAYLDPAGGLKVGPVSAGAVPGPAAYGRGGAEPTVTDAGLVMGYLNSATYAGGGFDLRADLAIEAITGRVAAPLKLDTAAAAAGIHTIVNTAMAEAVRLVSVRRGYDLRGIALVAMGGAGPVHAGRLLELLGAQAVVVPPQPGVASALGLLMADIRHEFFRSYPKAMREASVSELSALFQETDAYCAERMRADGVPLSEVSAHRYAEMRYRGQSYELAVPLPPGPLGEGTLAELRQAFHQVHDRYYGHHSPESETEFVGLRGIHLHKLPPPNAQRIDARPRGRAEPVAARRAFFPETGGYTETPVYERFSLPVGQTVPGPAILDQPDTTTVIYPGQIARAHESGSIIVTRSSAAP